MNATGMVRRVDDLGRIVIPKEVRRILKIDEGDPLEIFTEGRDTLCLKRYSPFSVNKEFAEICKQLFTDCYLVDRWGEKVIGNKTKINNGAFKHDIILSYEKIATLYTPTPLSDEQKRIINKLAHYYTEG